MTKIIYLVLTICFADGQDCQIWVPDKIDTYQACESFAIAQNYGIDTDWQCVEEGAPLEGADYQDSEVM